MTIWIHLDRITFHGNRDHVSWFLYIYIYIYDEAVFIGGGATRHYTAHL